MYNDPDGTRNDLGGLYYDQSPVTPTDFYFIKDSDNHPELHWSGAPHLTYNIYATYELYEGGTHNEVYTANEETYTDVTVTLVKQIFANQTVTYTVTSINGLGEESDHSEEIVLDVDGDIWKAAASDSTFIPDEFSLLPAYPNPFNPGTNIVFDLPEKSRVYIKVYDVTGKEITMLINNTLSAGRHKVTFGGNGLSSGIYFVRLIANDYIKTRKVILMK